MNREEIIDMARKAGINFDPDGPGDEGIDTWYGNQYLPSGAIVRLIEIAQERLQAELAECKADLTHADSILQKIEGHLDGVNYKGTFDVGVLKVLEERNALAIQCEKMRKALDTIATSCEIDTLQAAIDCAKPVLYLQPNVAKEQKENYILGCKPVFNSVDYGTFAPNANGEAEGK